MKLLKQYHSSVEAEIVAAKLEEKGILAFVSSKKSQSLGSYFTGAFSSGLWVVLDHQYDDAVGFLSNKNHLITSALSRKKMREQKANTELSANDSLRKIANASIWMLIVLLILVVYYIYN